MAFGLFARKGREYRGFDQGLERASSRLASNNVVAGRRIVGGSGEAKAEVVEFVIEFEDDALGGLLDD